MNEKKCPSCGNINTNSQEFDEFISCKRCSLIYRKEFRFSNYNKNETYSNSELYEEQEQRNLRSFLFLLQNFNFRPKKSIPDSNEYSFLDIGSGNSNIPLGMKIKYKNLEVEVLEPNEKACENYLKKGIVGHCFDINNPELNIEKKYDLITCFHVFEHLPTFDQAIENIKKLLKEDGKFVCEVPNLDEFSKTIKTNGPFQQFNKEHLSLFSTKSFFNLFVEKGLNIIKLDSDLSIKIICEKERNKLQYYCDESNKEINIIFNNISRNIDKNSPIVLYGFGSIFTHLYPRLKEHYKIVAIADDYRFGEEFEGYKIEKLENIEYKENQKVIICSVLYKELLKNNVKKYGYDTITV